ncbi:TLD-domain-containing protein [Chlamydoabsidia padenii]|nr:TLD-domain-containing protein [Chlamydoabsidia padenii]
MGQSNSSETNSTPVTTSNESKLISSQSTSGSGTPNDIPSLKRKKSIQQVKQKLTRSELLALHHTFQHLKTTSSDHGDFIEPKGFLEHLHLPLTLEPAGILLFKSFSRLGAYPNCDLISAPIHLSWNSFLTAFAVLTGKLDDPKNDSTVFETTFFNSLAILPRPTFTTPATIPITEAATNKNEMDDHTQPNQITSTSATAGYTLADFGIQFDDDDMAGLEGDEQTTDPQDTLKILRNDLKELFILALWIVHAEHAEQLAASPDIDSIRQLADTLTNTIYSIDNHSTSTTTTGNKNDDEDEDSSNCISHRAFCAWKSRNAPYLFKTIQSFIYTRFAMNTPNMTAKLLVEDQHEDAICDDTSSLRTIDLVLSQDIAPLPTDTDILDTNSCALLSWCLPPVYLTTKQWGRLYSGDKDGFSMNRFENHVFKYPGPTLLVMEIQVTHYNHGGSSKKVSVGNDKDIKLTLALLISEPWKQGRNYWGTDQTFLLELQPRFELFKATGRNQQYVYYQQQIGLAFGGTTTHPPPRKLASGDMAGDGCVLFLDNTLQTGRYYHEKYPVAPTFEKSQQNQDPFDYGFDIEHLEVFGLGDEKMTLAQKKAWAFEHQDATRRAGVQIRQQDGQVDKEILIMAGIIQDDHHHNQRDQH